MTSSPPSIEAGFAFYTPKNQDAGVRNHLWVIVSDPAKDRGRVLMVNITSKPWDTTCVVEAKDDSFAEKRSYVYYEGARIAALADIEKLLATNTLTPRERRISSALLARIRRGFVDSPHASEESRRILLSQGLVKRAK